ncbi:MAG: hypothetical protein KatS3mg115_0991 [Candidatus Poribacteria bacterium]|nr:MAG: hypothetical protein KatS3mg115_0991 [Candidatus Poribacteria bacterium]
MPLTSVPLYEVHDFSLKSETKQPNPFLVELKADFEHETGAKLSGLPGFYDGDSTWKVRFSPFLLGIWRGVLRSEDPELNGRELEPIECLPNENPRLHGRVQIDLEYPHRFRFEDGTPYVPLGFECDWLFAFHQERPELFGELLDRISDRGFNHVVMNVYAHTGFSDPAHPWVFGPPKLYAWEGTNDAPDHSRPNLAFYRDLDETIRGLHERGITAHLMIHVHNKRVNWPALRSPEDDLYWRYVLARYQAFCNVIWDVGKESYNYVRKYNDPEYPIDRIEFIRRHDAYGHLVTVHDPVGNSPAHLSRTDLAADFTSDQIHLGDEDAYNREAIRRWRLREAPYMNIEYGYERGVEEIKTYQSRTTADWQTVLRWTWAIYLGGGYPCYYYNNTAWDLIKYEPEPPGWVRYRHLRRFLERADLNPMVPDNEYVNRGFCSAEPGRQYLIYLPEGGGVQLDLTAVPKGREVRALWMDIYTGEEAVVAVEERGFRTGLSNPLREPEHPCAVLVRAEEAP